MEWGRWLWPDRVVCIGARIEGTFLCVCVCPPVDKTLPPCRFLFCFPVPFFFLNFAPTHTRAPAADCICAAHWESGVDHSMPNTSVRERHAAAVQRLFKKNRSLSPASWVTPNARLYGGTLAPEIHLTNQWQLANEMGSAPSANGETVAAAAASTCGAHVDYGDPSQSCYSMGRRIARHEWAMTAGEKRKLQGQPCLREEQKERRAAVERQQAILCYEMSIPRRRVLGHISQLTAAQMDLCKAVPTARTAERLVQLKGGRWVLQNPYRQQLLGGEPVMTRVMRGEFYEGQRAEKKGINYCQINKRHVNVASDVNRVMRNTRSE